MKKINLVNLMLRAWDIRRADGCTMAEALRAAWAEVKAAKYGVHMNEKRDSVTACLVKLVANAQDIHDLHKIDILRAALRAEVVDGVAMMCGKWAGLVKWAVANA